MTRNYERYARRRKQTLSEFRTLHIAAYYSWKHMKERCDNPKHPKYKFYGGRGINYDIRWKRFENFVEDMGDPTKDLLGRRLTLNRQNNDGDYTKSNCNWATYEKQNNNRSIKAPEKQVDSKNQAMQPRPL